jgi:hypothetical protein
VKDAITDFSGSPSTQITMLPGSKPRPDLDPLPLECTYSVAPMLSTAFYKDLFPALLLGLGLQPGLPEPVTLADLGIPNRLS